MGGRGNTGSRSTENTDSIYPAFPEKTKFFKYEDTWILQDANKDRSEDNAFTDYVIERQYYGGYHGRGTGSVSPMYLVRYKRENLVEKFVPGRRAFGTLKEAKSFLIEQNWRKK